MGELWNNCLECTKAMVITIICFPFIPILLLYWFLHSEQIHGMWTEIHDGEERTERPETPIEVRRLREYQLKRIETIFEKSLEHTFL